MIHLREEMSRGGLTYTCRVQHSSDGICIPMSLWSYDYAAFGSFLDVLGELERFLLLSIVSLRVVVVDVGSVMGTLDDLGADGAPVASGWSCEEACV